MRTPAWAIPTLVLGSVALSPPVAGQCPIGARSAAGDAVAIRVGAGSSHRATMTTDQTSSQILMGAERTSHQKTITTIRYEVADASGGRRLVTITYERVQVDSEGPNGRVTWDSADSTAAVPQGVSFYAALVGQPYTVSVSEDGATRKLEEWDAVADRLLGSFQPTPGLSREEAKSRIAREVGDRALTEALSGALMVLPRAGKDVGSTWSCTLSSAAPMPVAHTSTFTLGGRKGDVGSLVLDGTLVSDSTIAVPMGGTPVRYAVKGTSRGSLDVAEETGWVLGGRVETEMIGAMIVPGPAGDPMSVPIHTTSVVTVERPGGGG